MPLLRNSVKPAGAGTAAVNNKPALVRSGSISIPNGWRGREAAELSDELIERPVTSTGASSTGVFSNCANPECGSGWLHLLRRRSGPIFEGGWNCSASCTAARIETALRRELDGHRRESMTHRHRVPLGLVMLEHGWITS